MCLLALPAVAEPAFDRLLGAVAAYRPIEPALAAEIRGECGADLRCAATALVARLGPPARLEPVVHPDTDVIRRAVTAPSVTTVAREPGGSLRVVLERFGRKADRELLDAVPADMPDRLILDLRANEGGDFDRMRRVAALFTGARADAVRLIGRDGAQMIAIPAPPRVIRPRRLEVWVSGRTASSAEVLAALLRRFAGARILGARTRGKDYLVRLIPIDHDWRLLLPAERIAVPGEILAGGLTPDGAPP